MGIDTSARPHELLKLRIKDIVFERQYARVLVNGKTGSRSLVLVDSIPYVKEWISQHPQRNDEAILLCSIQRKRMSTRTLDKIFSDYQTKYFPALLKTDISLEDRIRIRELLRKPWNPYIFRHTSLTEKCKLINEVACYYGNEASNAILKARGILPDNQQDTRLISKPKECPNCSELNDPLGKFCIRYKMVLRYEGYAEILEAAKKKDQDYQGLKERMDKMGNVIVELNSSMQFFKDQFENYKEVFGPRPLTKSEREKIEEFRERLKNISDSYDDD